MHVVVEQEPWEGRTRPGSEGGGRHLRGGRTTTLSHVTFHKKSHGEGEAVHADRHQSGRGAGEQDYSIDPEEQVHGAVLPVHQLNPGVLLPVVEVAVRPAHHKLFDHYPCGRDNSGQTRSTGGVVA